MGPPYFLGEKPLYPSSRCPECPLFSQVKNFVPGEVRKNASMVFVGEAPGEREVVQRKPFVGPAGQLFNKILSSSGVDRNTVSVTNVLKCRPEKNKLPEDLDLAMRCCSEILKNDIKEAKVIVGFGNVPLKFFIGKDGITKRRGSVYRIEEGLFIGTIHPSALMRAQHVRHVRKLAIPPIEIVIADVIRAKELIEKDIVIPPEGVNIILEPGEEDKNRFLKRMNDENEMVGVDIETTWEERVEHVIPQIISFAFDDEVIVVSFEEDLEFVFTALKTPCRKVMQNGVIFDEYVLSSLGFEINGFNFDLMYAHHLMYAELKHDLGFIQSLYSFLPYHKDMRSEFEEIWEK